MPYHTIGVTAMMNGHTIALILPARNEELSLPGVLSAVPSVVDRIIVVDNGSSDRTASIARSYGAEVVSEPVAGYGRACLAGIARLDDNPPDLIAFVDADGSDDLGRLQDILFPIVSGEADFVLTRRIPVNHVALSPQQRFGGWLAVALIRLFWGYRYTDLGPMRALSCPALKRLGMRDHDFGWTVEMQISAVREKLRIQEIPVPYRPRIAGESKISRTITGTFRAGMKILWVIGREAFRDRERNRAA
jgi:glycosyltransferase involved in cell wall biosynthesis